jgi:hypothetical protein
MVAEISDYKKIAQDDGSNFDEINNFRYVFSFYDVETEDSIYEWFEERHYQGGGPTWRGVIFGLIMLHEPQNSDKVDYDDEGDGLVVMSNDYDLLSRVLQWTTDAKYNEELRLKAVEMAEEHGEME